MKLLRMIALGIMVLGAVVTGTARAEATAKPRVALVMKSLANEFFQTMQAGAKNHQRTHADQYELLATGIKDEVDTASQIRLIEQMLARRVNVLVVAPADSKALVPVLESAVSRGIMVINIDNRLDEKALAEKNVRIPFVGPDNRAGAKLAGEHLARQLNRRAKVAIIEGIPTTVNAQQRTLGFRDIMAAQGFQIVAIQSGDWELQKSNMVAAAILRAHPDLAAFLCGNDTMALGAAAAVKSLGKTKQVKIVGYDNIPAIRPMLRDGRIVATVDQFASEQAVAAIEIALHAVAKKMQQAQLPASVNTRVALVTR